MLPHPHPHSKNVVIVIHFNQVVLYFDTRATGLCPQGPDSRRDGRKTVDVDFFRRYGVALDHVVRNDIVANFGRPVDVDETPFDVKPSMILLQVRRHVALRDFRRDGVAHLSDG